MRNVLQRDSAQDMARQEQYRKANKPTRIHTIVRATLFGILWAVSWGLVGYLLS